MSRDLSRRDLLAGTGAALGTAIVGSALARTALGAADASAVPRWGLAIDVGRCAGQTGCRRCIDACHQAHRVPAAVDPRHEIKWVWKESFSRVFPEQVHGYEEEAQLQLPVLVMCNHCRSAPCTRVCPTSATWRRSDGVVAMDEHRCIGCRYCMAACPYGARSFNWKDPRSASLPGNYPARTTGVVEKCTLCVERLDAGQIPLCVETCQRAGFGALTFGNLDDASSTLRRMLATRRVLRRRPALGTEPRVFYLV